MKVAKSIRWPYNVLDTGSMDEKGQSKVNQLSTKGGGLSDFVLEKHIFSNIFEKDIRRVFVYKKAERLAKAIYLISPAFSTTLPLRHRAESIAVAIIDASILSPGAAKAALSRELLALSSILSIGRANGFLSPMNAELMAREAQHLLQEIAAYEEPRLFLEELASLAELNKVSKATLPTSRESTEHPAREAKHDRIHKGHHIGHLSDSGSARREAIVSVLKEKGPSYIRDISGIVRNVSEKTIQRELQSLVRAGLVLKKGERRWTVYQLPQGEHKPKDKD